jgi:hypothetical protein
MVGGIAASKHQVHALLNSRQQKHRTDRQTKRARYQTVGLYRGVDSSYVSHGYNVSLFNSAVGIWGRTASNDRMAGKL